MRKILEMPQTAYLPHIAYDSVIFGFSEGDLKILIMEYHNTGLFALPGGFVQLQENLNDAVLRGLNERTGLTDIYLEQFYTFGDFSRFDPEVMRTLLEANGIVPDEGYQWMLDRFISVAYYALINYEDVTPKPDALSDSCEWYPVNELPKLILDHQHIVEKAIQTLRDNLDRKLVGGNLLPRKFTMSELQNVYEAILGTKLRRTTFQRKMLAADVLTRHEKHFSGKAHMAPYLYSFKYRRCR
ncbi:ADP-ribose pyrophosphatase YjhB (NUDIX family) [Dyadobacter sp. BE34]|uniref:ADP-ribose pyrophosphatase YjhB (NUDIX family) n=2 Tax=Spirosomataceae TaxID=2896860 RepID=A0ABU1QUD9_9BACT|nr:ADP-ribose pyrophosphatase YjhB (NUDIX family) [Dyadobacter fermentans]MDR7043477.1 ADP-ribose pyrophosphatase YjhB (NUDIX family) [Dyadobacter sp. BE242]MDR7197789.1 ADP-ribose pyrophosphatase YjhB (NUDIX family) [Dyadobacter sp. BE34]MDR7214778.1 ADP-ribose pyrophosphatase YjhB (NUDIX family) [Dyadobacter sp. BE31]MDR7262313.1 ADP-ribose pyrophosphatase YjhB (NUDIX family) [Dyadobacter sp. BE32]